MPTRLVSLLVVLLTIPGLGQHDNHEPQIHQKLDWGQQVTEGVIKPTPAEQAAAAQRLQSIYHDAEELSALSTSVQSDLQQLGKGLVAKDIAAHLKKMEKLSKKLRQEINP